MPIDQSSRDQLAKKQSDLEPTGLTNVAEVVNLQIASNPGVGAKFSVTPIAFVVSSTANSGAFLAGTHARTWQLLSADNVSSSMSAVSAAINLAMPAAAGVAALTAAGSRTDIALTADLAGMEIEHKTESSAFVFSQTTANRGGHTLGEGFVEYITSAGNTVRAKDPAEATRLAVQFPSQRR